MHPQAKIALPIAIGMIEHEVLVEKYCESSSAGRARPCQGRGRGSESRLSLKQKFIFSYAQFLGNLNEAQVVELVDTLDLKSNDHCDRAGSSPALGTKQDKRSFSTSCFFLPFPNSNEY